MSLFSFSFLNIIFYPYLISFLTQNLPAMSFDLPRVILIDSDSIEGTSFLCGFVSLQEGNNNSINAGTFYLGQNGDLPYIMFSENSTVKVDQPVQSLPAYIFTGGMPEQLDVLFENQSGKKSPKIRVTATMGHPNTDLPVLYLPRPFILCDSFKGNGSGTECYGILMDIYEGDQILCQNLYELAPIVSVDSSNQIAERPATGILLFNVNIPVPSFTLDLEAQGLGIRIISTEKAPTFYTLNQ